MASSIDPSAEIMHILLTDPLALQIQPVQPSKIPDGEIEHEGQPFRLLDLPKEIQLNVVEKHFEGSQLNFKANAEGTIVCKSVSSLELERSSKHLQGLCLKTRNEKIPKTLHFLMPVDMQVFILYLTSQPQFAWIRSHVEMIMFTQSPKFSSPPDWQLLCTSIPNLVQVSFACSEPCFPGSAALSMILKSASRTANGMARVLRDGFLIHYIPSLINNEDISGLCRGQDETKPRRLGVSLTAVLQFLSHTNEPLFSMHTEEYITANGLMRDIRHIYTPDGSVVAYTGKTQPITIKDSNGSMRTWIPILETNARPIHPDDVEDLFRALNVDPEVLNRLNFDQADDEDNEGDGEDHNDDAGEGTVLVVFVALDNSQT